MAPASTTPPHDPGPGPGGLYDGARLAQRLGITAATLRQHRAASAPWLPTPAGTLNGGAVWEAAAVADIEKRRAELLRPGRRRAPTAPDATDQPDGDQPQRTTDADDVDRTVVTAPVQETTTADRSRTDGEAVPDQGWWS